MKNIAIVTGGSSGFGYEFVKLLNDEKNIEEIWIIGRNQDKLDAVKNEFREKIKTISLDLSDINSVKVIKEKLNDDSYNISYLVNNAGYGKFCSYEDLSLEDSINMINLNITGVVGMTLTCIPFMDKGSHIINIASQAGFQPLPYLNIYGSTKAFVKNYSFALGEELKSKGVIVTTVCPSWMNTKFFERGRMNVKKAPRYFYGMTGARVVAKKAMKDAKRNKSYSSYGFMVQLSIFMAKLLPEKWIMKIWLLQQRIK